MRLHETNQMDRTGRSWVDLNYHSSISTKQTVITIAHFSNEPSLRTRAYGWFRGFHPGIGVLLPYIPRRERNIPGKTPAAGATW
jgi:hypothetical protein